MGHTVITALAALLNSLPIALALALAAWLFTRALPGANAATRHLVWWTVVALLLIVPTAGLDRAPRHTASIGVSGAAPLTVFPMPAPIRRPAPRSVFPVRLSQGGAAAILVAIWLVYALVQLWRIALSFARLRAIKHSASTPPAAPRERFRGLVADCGIRRPVRLLISDRIVSPMAVGFFRPAVILPRPLLDQFSEAELDHVLLHELAHVERRDDWTNLFVHCLTAAIGLHPVAAWVLRQIERERELACDEWVVSRTGDARPYAASLARLFEACHARRHMMLAAGMAGSASQLGQRIDILLDRGRRFSTRASLARVALASVALLAIGAAGFRAPHWIVLAQSSPIVVRAVPRPVMPVQQHGSFLAALVAAGYGDLPVDEIVSLKDHGITADFLTRLSHSGWDRLTTAEMIELWSHGVPPELLGALRDAGFTQVPTGEIVSAFARGLTAETVRRAARFGSQLTLEQMVRLKQTGVLQ